MNETPRTDDEEKSTDKLDDQDWGQAGWRHARQLERELNEARKQRDDLADEKLNNPFCAACKETDCCISGDGTCSMIRKYQSVIIEESEKLPIKNFVAEVMKQAEGGEF